VEKAESKSRHLFEPGDLVCAWHRTKLTLVDPPPPLRPEEMENYDFKPNEAYKGYLIVPYTGTRYRVIRQVGKPFTWQDHMTDRLVASYVLWDRNFYYSTFTSNHFVKEDMYDYFVKNHSFDMNHTLASDASEEQP